MTPFSAARMTVRVVGAAMLVLGLVIWTGSADGLVPIHMLLGIVLVLALWAVAVLALQAGARPALPAITIAWGILVAGFGMAQAQILPDDSLHLVVEVAHLVFGLVAIRLAEALGAASTRTGARARQ
jgi:hypothetical protein